jgi:hypothetical protein
LRSYHDCVAGGCHLGIQRTFLAIKRKFFWHGYYQDVLEYARSCDCCQRIKVDRHPRPAPLINMPIDEPFGRWHMDILGPLPKSKEGYHNIFF